MRYATSFALMMLLTALQSSLGYAQSRPAPVAQTAVLYEEDPNDPMGKRLTGSAIWQTETIPPRPGQPPEPTIRVDVEIPDRNLAMTISIRRNSDLSLPASYTFEYTFKGTADFVFDDIANIPGILMKQSERSRGEPLRGLTVRVTNGFFMTGLSDVTSDRERNILLLKQYSWFDIPLVFRNNRRAIIAIEKGTSGERVFTEAFAAWGQ